MNAIRRYFDGARSDGSDRYMCESNEWLLGRMDGNSSDEDNDDFVFEDDDLTWRVVSQATGAEDPSYHTRGKGVASSSARVDRGKDVASSSTRVDRGKGIMSLVDDDEIEEDLGTNDLGYQDSYELGNDDDLDL